MKRIGRAWSQFSSASAGETRAVSHVIHAAAATVFWNRCLLEALTYTEEQSRRNFERIQRLVVAGEPLKSALLVNPLAEEAGGRHWHGGGKHWTSQDSPERQILAAWVRGTTR